jgi:hypothetical protein
MGTGAQKLLSLNGLPLANGWCKNVGVFVWDVEVAFFSW